MGETCTDYSHDATARAAPHSARVFHQWPGSNWEDLNRARRAYRRPDCTVEMLIEPSKNVVPAQY